MLLLPEAGRSNSYTNKVMKLKVKLIRQFAYLISAFVVITIAVSAIVTYFAQTNMYRELCRDRVMSVGEFLSDLMLDDPDDFLAYRDYYLNHYEELRIPVDFNDCNPARRVFYREFEKVYPDRSFKTDIMPQDMPEDLQHLYYTYLHEHWILIFEQARTSFDLPYTYFLIPDDDTHYTMYMIDGERTEDPEHPGYLYMGDSYYEDPDEHRLMWDSWHNAKRYDEVYEWNNDWGNTYSYYTPLVVKGKCLGLVVTEIDVKNINNMIVKSTWTLVAQLGIILIILTAGLLFFINRKHIRRIYHLSAQINDFSTSRAYDTVDSIRSYPYGSDEIRDLAENTANMIKELQIHEEKIAAAAQFKSDFLANMSHEIRTPMNAVVGLSELLTKQGLDDKSREYAEQIHTSADTMLVIINDILDFSRIEDGRVDIMPVDYDIRKMIDDIVSIATMGLGDKPVKIISESAEDLPKYLSGDRDRISQVLINIISNAVKFTERGSVAIKTKSIPRGENEIDLIISVSDTGIGIKQEDYEKIFESFRQLDSDRNRKAEGTGLGLAISQRLVRLMGGSIEVESEYGEGSVFTITIPQKIAAATASEKDGAVLKTKVGFSAPDAKVLVVDDNSVNLFIAKSLLGLYQIKAVCVPSGADALKAVASHDFDLILMDYMMPEMDGIETMKRIREQFPTYEKVPIIAFTANAVADAREHLLESGMDDFISKPVKNTELEALLKKWLG